MNYPLESRCRKGGLHAYQPTFENSEAMIEVCQKCGDKVVYHKSNGRIDERNYAKRNARMILQPFGKTAEEYRKEYGKLGTKYNKRIIQAGKTIQEAP